jgi:hypothetical protein
LCDESPSVLKHLTVASSFGHMASFRGVFWKDQLQNFLGVWFGATSMSI